jgi:SAM-dependent methyltransferase
VIEADGWSDVADGWERYWGGVADPVRRRLVDVAGIGVGTRVLDVGCGSGEFLAALRAHGASAAGVDPARDMVAASRRVAPEADVREGSWERIPWGGATFDVVVAVNALQFADDTIDALHEAARVVRPGGIVAVANWAERALNELDALETALAVEAGEAPPPDGDLRVPGGLEAVLEESGLAVVDAGLVTVPWAAADAEALVSGILLGASEEDVAELGPVLRRAALPYRRSDGSYVLMNAFRYALGRVPSIPATAS